MHDTKADLVVRTTVSQCQFSQLALERKLYVQFELTDYTQHTIPTNPALFLYEFPSPTTLARHDCQRNDPGASPLPSDYPKHNSQPTALLLFGVANHSSNRQEERVSRCSGMWLTMFPGEHAHRTFFFSLRKHLPTTYPKLSSRE